MSTQTLESMEIDANVWQPVLNVVGGNMIWRIGKPLRDNEPLDAGNVEYAGTTFSKFEMAQSYAVRCNEDHMSGA